MLRIVDGGMDRRGRYAGTEETERARLRRRAAEIRAGMADAEITRAADELRITVARHDAKLAALGIVMDGVIAASGLGESVNEKKPRLRVIKGGKD